MKGLETLALRVDAACRGAAAIAEFLASQPEVTRVWYPTRADHPQPIPRNAYDDATLNNYELVPDLKQLTPEDWDEELRGCALRSA